VSALTVAGLASVAGPASAATGAQLDGDTLQIYGDNGSQKLAIYNQPDSFVLDIGEDGTADFTFNRTTFTAIEVDGKGGDDQIDSFNAGGAQDKAITLDGGAGNDTLRGSASAEKLLGGSGDDDVDGNIGADTIDLGSGNDRFQWDPGDGSDTVDGSGGNDTVDFNGSNASEDIALSANGSRVRLTRNIASINMDIGGVEQVRVRALGGTDNVAVGALQGTGVRSVSTDLRGFDGQADGAVDHVIAQGTDAADRFTVGASGSQALVNGPGPDVLVTAADAQDNIDVAAQGDADTITSDVTVPGPGTVNVDGGDGNDTALYRGSDGPDEINVARNGTAAVAAFVTGGAIVNHTAVESLDVRGLGGDDRILAQNGIGSLTSLTEEGGEGADDLRGGDGADTLLGGNGDDHVDGNIGADNAKLGNGDDHFQWDPGDGSDVVEGQSGADTLDFNGSNIGEQIDVSANAGRVRLNRNIASITMDFDGIEAAKIRALGGSDQVTVGDLSGTALKAANVDLAAFDGTGDGSTDTVVVNGRDTRADHVTTARSGDSVVVGGLPATTTISGSELLNDTLRINTLGGKDDVTTDPAAEQLISHVIDLGADQ
jgi:hypothetical protein